MALGSLMLSKNSVRQTLASEINSNAGKFDGTTADEQAALSLLRSCIAPYPALEAALFPLNASERYPKHGDAIFCRMLTLFQDSVPLRVGNVLGTRGLMLARRMSEPLDDDDSSNDLPTSNNSDVGGETSAGDDASLEGEDETPGDVPDELPNFSDPRYLRDAYLDQIDISYYLSEGQPTKAYELYSSERRGVNEARKIAHSMSISRLLDAQVGAACVTFLDLCGIPSQVLRIDLHAAKRIYNWLLRQEQAASLGAGARDFDEPLEHAGALSRVTKLFLTFQTVQRRRRSIADDDDFALTNADGRLSKQQEELITKALEEAKALLEEATAHLIATRAYDVDGSRGGSGDLLLLVPDDRRLSKEGCWRVVNLFCQHYELPLVPTHLVELAKENDWVNFLVVAQSHGFPARQVLSLAQRHFADEQLKEHISIVINKTIPKFSIAPLRNSASNSSSNSSNSNARDGAFLDASVSSSFTASDPDTIPDLFEELLNAQGHPYPPASLLSSCVQWKRPLLAVLAICYDDAPPSSIASRMLRSEREDPALVLDCLACWLYATCYQATSNVTRQHIEKLFLEPLPTAAAPSSFISRTFSRRERGSAFTDIVRTSDPRLEFVGVANASISISHSRTLALSLSRSLAGLAWRLYHGARARTQDL